MSFSVHLVLLVVAIGISCRAESETKHTGFGFFGHQLERRFKQLEAQVEELTAKLESLNCHPCEGTTTTPAWITTTTTESTTETVPPPSPGHGNATVCQTIEVVYEHNQYGGGWIVFQHRVNHWLNGSVGFYRGWSEYSNGFGSLDGEFWLGLEKIHLLTSSEHYELLVHLESFHGETKYARYGKFEIGAENEGYPMKALESYNGTAGDSLGFARGLKFAIYDRDNEVNCASTSEHHGAWWYKACSNSNLNGLYNVQDSVQAMYWGGFSNSYEGLKVSKMMIRKV